MKYLFYLLLVLGNAAAEAQTTVIPCWYTEDWDWTDPSEENWYAYVNTFGGGLSPQALASPFSNPSSSIDIHNIIEANDYLPSQGWVLLLKNFGCPGVPVDGNMPYFFLYNRYTAVVRLFFKSYNNENYHEAQFISKWLDENENTGLFALCNKYALPVDNYPLQDNSEKLLYYIQEYYSNGAWFTTEFPVAFDSNTSLDSSPDLLFKINNIDVSSLELDGDISFTTKSAGVKEAETVPSTTSGDIQELLVEGKEFVGKVPKSEDIKKFYENLDKGIHTIDSTVHSGFTHELHYLADQFQENTSGLKGFLIGLSQTAVGISAGLDVALSVLSFFTGKSTSTDPAVNSFQPTMSSGTLTLSGTLTSTTNAMAVQMQLPGTNHNTGIDGAVQYIGKPIYDCPLGNIALEAIPEIEYTHYLDRFADIAVHYPADEASYFYSEDEVTGAYIKSKSFRLKSDVEIALNAAARLRVDTILVGFVGEIQSPAYSILRYLDGDDLYNLEHPDAFVDYTINMPHHEQFLGEGMPDLTEALLNGTYQMLSMDSVNKKHTFGTQLMGLDVFRGTSFNVPLGTKLFLKVAAILRPIDEDAVQTPVLWSCTYEVTEDKIVLAPGGVDFYALSGADPGSDNPGISENMLMQAEEYLPPAYPTSFEQYFISNGDLYIHDQVVNSMDVERHYIRSGNHALIDANAGGISWKAHVRIKLEPGFKAQSAHNLFNARIVPDASILHGTDGGDVNSYFEECALQYRSAFTSRPSEQNFSENMSIYPNPAHEMCNLNWNIKGANQLIIYNSTGSIVRLQKLLGDENSVPLLIGDLPAGLYLVQISTSAGKSYIKQLIIE